MSHLFCTSTFKGKEIVSRLGEEDWRAIQSGLLSYDDMANITKKDQEIVLKQLSIFDSKPIIIATMHPIPRDESKTKKESVEFFKALGRFSTSYDAHIFITSPNSDSGRNNIIREINQLIKK